jgi:hypothetical protein
MAIETRPLGCVAKSERYANVVRQMTMYLIPLRYDLKIKFVTYE